MLLTLFPGLRAGVILWFSAWPFYLCRNFRLRLVKQVIGYLHRIEASPAHVMTCFQYKFHKQQSTLFSIPASTSVVDQRWQTKKSYSWPRAFQPQFFHRQLWINWPVYNNILLYDNSNSAVTSPRLVVYL